MEENARRESPLLRERVIEGSLPPLEERVPENPRVVEPRDEVGEYGGIMTIASNGGAADSYSIRRTGLVRMSMDTEEIVPEVAESVEWSDDYRTFTFHLREGLRWSDGHKFTTEDVEFWWKDLVNNEDYTTVFPQLYEVKGEKAELEIIDEYTFAFEFPHPNPTFTQWFSPNNSEAPVSYPKHYLKEFHIDYNPDAEKQAEEEGFNSWDELLSDRADRETVLDRPRLDPWVPVVDSPMYNLYERNPYYWKVDSAGNQLPYIDLLQVINMSDEEVLVTTVSFGGVDIAGAPLNLRHYPHLKRNEKKSGMKIHLLDQLRSSVFGFGFNQTPTNSAKEEIFQDVRFRRAFSLAIDREALNDIVYMGEGKPLQLAPLPVVPYYKEEWTKVDAGHDLERANELLDEMGLEWDKDKDWRLRPDGEELVVNFEFWPGEGPKTDIVELIKEFAADIGVKVHVRSQDHTYNRTRQDLGESDIFSWHYGTPTKYFRKSRCFPHEPGLMGGIPSVEWYKWLSSDGEEGEEPPEKIKEWYEVGQEWKYEPDDERRNELAEKLYDMHSEMRIDIGTVGLAPTPIAVTESLRNVPTDGYWGWPLHWWHVFEPTTFYFSDPERREVPWYGPEVPWSD